MVLTLPVDFVPALSGALWLATLLVLQMVTNVHLVRSGTWALIRGDVEPLTPPTVQDVATHDAPSRHSRDTSGR